MAARPARPQTEVSFIVHRGTLVNVVAAYALPRVSGQILIITGAVGTTLAAVLFAVIDPHAIYWTYGFFAISLSVFGADFIFSVRLLSRRWHLKIT
jgi:nitrate/nitrite transporter NarK